MIENIFGDYKRDNIIIRSRKRVIYENENPFITGVTHVAIQTQTEPPYIWAKYVRGQEIPDSIKYDRTMFLYTIDEAMKLFDIQKGKLTECKFRD